jgi:DNA-binding transcriptional regulator YiaG
MKHTKTKRVARAKAGRPVQPRDPIDCEALKRARIAAGIGGRNLAQYVSASVSRTIGVTTYYDWEAGRCNPPPDAVAVLEKKLKVKSLAKV